MGLIKWLSPVLIPKKVLIGSFLTTVACAKKVPASLTKNLPGSTQSFNLRPY